jgi:hypothetical protein
LKTIRDYDGHPWRPFYPVIATFVVVPVSLLSKQYWFGIVACLALFSLIDYCWTCVFGLFNVIWLVMALMICSYPLVYASREEARALYHERMLKEMQLRKATRRREGQAVVKTAP